MIIATKESRTNNYRENVMKDFDAITHVISLLFKTPRGSIPYALGLGFDLRDLLFKNIGSDAYESSVNDLRGQIRKVTGNADAVVNINRKSHYTDIIITVNIDGRQVNVTVPYDNESSAVRFKDIIVK